MKKIVSYSRYIVAIIFLISGFVKAVDPIGTAIKLEEYFDIFTQNTGIQFSVLNDYTVPIAIFLIVFELVLAIALILEYKMKITSWLLLLLMIKFTFLTGYSVFVSAITDCGCFGDAIKLTPMQSFMKDVVLLVPSILFVFHYKKEFTRKTMKIEHIIMACSVFVSLLCCTWNVLHEPMIDFRPYKVSRDLNPLLSDGKPAEYSFLLTNKKTGEKKIFHKTFPENLNLNWDDWNMESKETKKAVPATLGDFAFRDFQGQEVTKEILAKKVYLVFIKNEKEIKAAQIKALNELAKQAKKQGVEFSYVLAISQDNWKKVNQKFKPVLDQAYTIDGTVALTVMRSNPGLLLLDKGVIKGKWHYNDFPEKL